MSRCVSLNQALAKATLKSSGFSWNRFEIFEYSGSNRSERSVVSMTGVCRFERSWASGTRPAPCPPAGTHWCFPAGLFESSHSKPNRLSKNWDVQRTGFADHAPSSPLVNGQPEPALFFQPRPCCSVGAPAGSGPTFSSLTAPWVLPKVCPPAISATVSSSSMDIRLKVSRMSRAAATGSGLAFGPSGFT